MRKMKATQSLIANGMAGVDLARAQNKRKGTLPRKGFMSFVLH